MKEHKFPARLHAVFARSASTAVVFRRGPSKQVATYLWERSSDSFHLGQWLKGRIYERRTDLSPDGQHLIYFAMNGNWGSEARGSWTAVSKVPYLKALDLHPKGDCWEGGGLFLSNNKYWINDRYFNPTAILFSNSELKHDNISRPEAQFGSECTGVYYPRLLRDGWKLTKRSERAKWNSETIFEKQLDSGWLIRKIAHEQVDAPVGKGCYWDEHELIDQAGNVLAKPDWEWADWDNNSLVYAENGGLFRAVLQNSSIGDPKLLRDFNTDTFAKIAAPY